jgi:tetratricopeptide (TPR) repeat protein
MRLIVKILAFFSLAAVVVLVVYGTRRASLSESEIILQERSNLSRMLEQAGSQKEPSHELEEKLRFLDYRLASVYNAEGKPDAAIAVLEKLIAQERSRAQRKADSYSNEARYQEALARSYTLKKDEARAASALKLHDELMAKAIEQRKQERRGDGKFVGTPSE